MVSRRFACLFLAVSMTLSSIWIVSADQSHQIQDAAEAAASYSAAVQALEEAGLSQSAQANSNIAIDLGMLEQEETVDLSQLAVQAVQLQQEEEARQAEAARQFLAVIRAFQAEYGGPAAGAGIAQAGAVGMDNDLLHRLFASLLLRWGGSCHGGSIHVSRRAGKCGEGQVGAARSGAMPAFPLNKSNEPTRPVHAAKERLCLFSPPI